MEGMQKKNCGEQLDANGVRSTIKAVFQLALVSLAEEDRTKTVKFAETQMPHTVTFARQRPTEPLLILVPMPLGSCQTPHL